MNDEERRAKCACSSCFMARNLGRPLECDFAVKSEVYGDVNYWREEATRLRKLFDDAGEGEYNVLALIDHYQEEALAAEERAEESLRKLRAVRDAAKALHDCCDHAEPLAWCQGCERAVRTRAELRDAIAASEEGER